MWCVMDCIDCVLDLEQHVPHCVLNIQCHGGNTAFQIFIILVTRKCLENIQKNDSACVFNNHAYYYA